MFNSLRTRLLFSYAFILIVTLLVIGVALLLMLDARPIPTEEISQRLAIMLQTLEGQAWFTAITLDGPGRVEERLLNTYARQAALGGTPVRVLITRLDQSVIYDALRIYRPGEQLNLDAQPYTPPEIAPDADQGSPPQAMTRGNLRDPNGSTWHFVSQAGQGGLSYILALRAPLPLSFPELVQYYGEDILIPLLQAGLIGLLVAFVMALLVTRSVAEPLQKVALSVTAVTLGKLDQRAPISGPREVRTVAEAFNRMTDQVEASQQAQRDFMANVTHDLRTPLTSIQGFSQAIIDGVASDPSAAQRAAHIIYDEAGRLNRMVEELLDLARIEAGRWNMTRQTVKVDEVIRSVGERLTPKAAEHGLSLVMQVPTLPPIGGDGDRLVQVFTNLIDNAIKHTPSGGSVTLRAILHENGVLAQISDTGEGIPAEDVPHIFDRFYQVDKSRQRGSRQGVGLGLTITKQIVEAHGGKIWAESQEGAGTTISVWFPAPTADATTILRRRPNASKH